jgi:hypothetical protein
LFANYSHLGYHCRLLVLFALQDNAIAYKVIFCQYGKKKAVNFNRSSEHPKKTFKLKAG